MAVTNARENFYLITFDLHPAAASVALLPPPELVVYEGGINRETRRQAFNDGYEAFAVGFSGGDEIKSHFFGL